MIYFSKIHVIEEIIKTKIITASAIGHQSDHPIIQDIVDLGYDTPSSFAKAIKEHNNNIIYDLYLKNKEINKKINNIYNSIKINIINKNKIINLNFNNILIKKQKQNKLILNEINNKIDKIIEKNKNYEIIKIQKRNFKIILSFVFILLSFILYLITNT
jgi:exonuclease VII large subunit